ncbi:MAG: glycoside hydrolase family 16 protein [Marinilabiliales bacterium]|nr:glycoside hydrolase family 16 protein [Marinilabiliales bacterium]
MRTVLIAILLCWIVLSVRAQRAPQGPLSKERYTAEKLGYQLAWEDQFNGTSLDTTKWRVRGVGKRRLDWVSASAVKVKNGCLHLMALRQGDSLLSGAVGTQGLFMSRYGYYECRARVQRSSGVWGAFWIQSAKISAGEDPALFGAEIDIMECFKKLGKDIVSHNVHWAYGPHQQSTHGMQSHLKGVGKGFHLFALEWLPDRYIFYVDGYKFYEVTKGISQIDEYMILSMEFPGEKSEIARTRFPDAFVVDWVKYYKK